MENSENRSNLILDSFLNPDYDVKWATESEYHNMNMNVIHRRNPDIKNEQAMNKPAVK